MDGFNGNSGQESDSFEMYVKTTLQEAATMLVAEHQRLAQPRGDTARARAIAATAVARSNARRRGSNESTSQRTLDAPGMISDTFAPQTSNASRNGEDYGSRNSENLADPATMLAKLQGQVTPSRGSMQSSLARSSAKSARDSEVSVEGVLSDMESVVPPGSDIRVRASNAQESVRSQELEVITSQPLKASQKLSSLKTSAMAWIGVAGHGQNGTSSDNSIWRSVTSRGSNVSSSSRFSNPSVPPSSMKKVTEGRRANGRSGIKNLFDVFDMKSPRVTSATSSRRVSFNQDAEELECSREPSMISQDGYEMQSRVRPPPLRDLIEDEQGAPDSTVSFPTDDVQRFSVEPASIEELTKDSVIASRPASGVHLDRLRFSDTDSLIVPLQASPGHRFATGSRQNGDDLPEGSLQARVAAARSSAQSEFNAYQSDDMPSNKPSLLDLADVRFPMLDIWVERNNSARKTAYGAPPKRGLTHFSMDKLLEDEEELEDLEFREPPRCQCVRRACNSQAMTPNTSRRMLWDGFAAFLVLYECIIIPLQFVDLEPEVCARLAWVVRIYWTIDMPLSFSTGYVLSDGTHEIRFYKVAIRYLSTWFVLDFVVLLSDWIEVIIDEMSYAGAARAGKTTRAIRIIRIGRLARVFKFKKMKTPEIFEMFMETIFSAELLPVIFNVIKIVCVFAWINHVMACLWFSIGEARFGNNNWIDGHEMSSMTKEYIYVSAYHWSLQQFAGAAEVWPWNMEERVFAVIFGVITFVVAAAFVSSLTSSMTHFEIINSQDSKRLTQLKHFLFDSGISHAVAMRVQRNAQHALKEEKRNMPESSIELLPKLSEPLRMEIHYDMFMPLLEAHPFFRLYNEISPFMMRNVCHTACIDLKLSAGDVLFCEGEVPKDPHVFFVKYGSMNYRHHSGYKETAGPGKWAAEAGVWCTWVHCGSMVATEECTLLVLVASMFQKTCSHFLKELEYAREYGRAFLKHLNSMPESELTDLEDPEMDIEWLAMQTCHFHVKPTGLIGRLARRSSRRGSNASNLRRSSTSRLRPASTMNLRRHISSKSTCSKASEQASRIDSLGPRINDFRIGTPLSRSPTVDKLGTPLSRSPTVDKIGTPL